MLVREILTLGIVVAILGMTEGFNLNHTSTLPPTTHLDPGQQAASSSNETEVKSLLTTQEIPGNATQQSEITTTQEISSNETQQAEITTTEAASSLNVTEEDFITTTPEASSNTTQETAGFITTKESNDVEYSEPEEEIQVDAGGQVETTTTFNLESTTPEAQCSPGWILLVDTCLEPVDDKVTWDEAREACKQKSADLVRLDNRIKYREMKVKLDLGKRRYWIGLRNEYWLDDLESNLEHFQRLYHSHDPLPSDQDKCYVADGNKKQRWKEERCDSKFRYICERDMFITPTTTINPVDELVRVNGLDGSGSKDISEGLSSM